MLNLIFPDLRLRNTTDQEKMDQADADPELLLRTIRQFHLINALFSASRRLLRRQVFSLMEQNPARTYSLLDVGAGGCDIALWAARAARRRGLKLKITALDNDPRILPAAHQKVRDFPEVRILEGNALDLSSLESFDFIFSNHFLHHLSWDQIQIFVQSLIARTRIAFVMNDLKRSRGAYLGATLCLGLLARRSFAYYDGRLSIRRGFQPEELRDFIQKNFPDVPIRVIETPPSRVVLLLRKGAQEPTGHSL
ncbi:Methyltransferase domain-containing protein [Geoalkalibacter ferrihydriticus]|uniref:Methyltransferase domain-containing protein n=1 Tax=Geoalkalibacter ferrihydriticus TaxID=392333 RepID=A0A1G9KE25_9BACT|nr:methyltransferase domain-containing protein [Geoalkalibacter ferrihydriticus]SDL47951.1 Methyltransferase domain-containing protein [Geoalkalibacter ferrihydriticus]